MKPKSIQLSAIDLKLASEEPLQYVGGWYDYSGAEYAHATEEWLRLRVWELTGIKDWAVDLNHAGNGHYSVTLTAK